MKISAHEVNVWHNILRLYRGYMRPYLSQILVAVAFMVVVAVTNVCIVQMVQPSVDLVFVNKDRQMLFWIPLITIILYAIKGFAEFYQNFLVELLGQKILTDLQMSLYKHLIYSDIDLIEKNTSARLISRFTNDIALMRNAITAFLVGVAKHGLSILFLILLMFQTEFTMSCMLFIVFPLIIYLVSFISKKLRNLSSAIQEELGYYTVKLDETFQSIKIVKSFLMEKSEVARARVTINKLLVLYKKSIKYSGLISPITEIINGLAVCFIVVYGGLLIFEDKTTGGAIFTFITAFVSAYRPFKTLLTLNSSLQEGLAASTRLFKLLDRAPVVENTKSILEITAEYPSIEFRNVDYVIKHKSILNEVDFVVEPKTFVALVGLSGSGKTSIINLLLHFKTKSSGQILIDGVDIDDINIESLRRHISFVSQDVMLFDGTIMDNIRYGNQVASDEDVYIAAREAFAAEFIERLPDGYHTLINTKATSLSGGQKQRLAIARALLKRAPILLLDEAAGGIDVNTEIAIYKKIKKSNLKRSVIVITHRLNTITNFDKILVMHDGVVVESGAHEALLKNKSHYYNLYNSYLETSDNIEPNSA